MALAISPARRTNDRDHAVPFRRVAVSGQSLSVVLDDWSAGSRSVPTIHFWEVLGYVVSGTVDLFLLDPSETGFGVRLEKGAFYRIPAGLSHWMHAASGEATTSECFCPGPFAVREAALPAEPLLAEWETGTGIGLPDALPIDTGIYKVSVADEAAYLANPPTGLFRQAKQVEAVAQLYPDRPSNNKTVQRVHGHYASIMAAQRPAWYHSTPHIHACEQINLMTRGSFTCFSVRTEAMSAISGGHAGDASRNPNMAPYAISDCHEGDIFRNPNMALHWAWNRTAEECELIEFHSPALAARPKFQHFDIALEPEVPSLMDTDRLWNIQIQSPENLVSTIERTLLAEGSLA